MNIYPLEFSVVVVGQDCNPTILNPDFLERRNIVPADWGWKLAGPPITTPPFATVTFDAGVTVKVETNRFQVSDQKTAGDVARSKIREIAQSYIGELPHVRYTAVGINFRSLVEMNEPDRFLIQKFLKAGPWDQQPNCLQGLSLTLAYPHDEGKLNLSLGGAAIELEVEDHVEVKQGILAAGNYHRDCEGYPSDGLVMEHIGRAADDARHFGTILKTLLSGESEQASRAS